MPKSNIIYVCESCGNEFPVWSGKCSACGAWNSLKEFKPTAIKAGKRAQPAQVTLFDKIKTTGLERTSTKFAEVDRVLGGGIVSGSVILIGGEPGIGKSTLLMQVASKINKVLYVSGEESPAQLKIRADRLGIKSNNALLVETDVNIISATIEEMKPSLAVIDSIQTMFDETYPSTAGSLVQVRECALKLQQLAKRSGVPIVLVGHVTKEGTVAGPRTLEHLVDVVLYLEGERYHENRILRTVKNRFGATDEIGIFQMGETGLVEVKNPSQVFLKERLAVAGSVVTATIEGTRPLLVEIQALTTPTVFGYPRRTASGFDLNRLQLLIAVLIKRAGINLSGQDVYVNVVGGFKLREPACDLAVAAAIASAYKNKQIKDKYCIFGELGLSGEIRPVLASEKRAKEASRLGFAQTVKNKIINKVLEEILQK